MANLLDFYFEQLVQESDMDTLQANLEAADLAIMADQVYTGVVSGYAVVQHAPIADLTVDVGGPGIAYDQEGRRVFMPSSQTLDVSVDSGGSPTTVVTPGNEKWVSVFVQFERVSSDLRTDGNGLPVNFRQDEGFSFVVVQGAEALIGTAPRPGLLPDAMLIADVRLENGTTQIFDADIESADVATNPTSRFEYIFNLTASSPAQIRVGPIPEAMQAVLTEINNHIANLGNAHPASAIDVTPVGNLAATDAQSAFAELDQDIVDSITDLLGADNTWTGTNDFNDAVTVGGASTFDGTVRANARTVLSELDGVYPGVGVELSTWLTTGGLRIWHENFALAANSPGNNDLIQDYLRCGVGGTLGVLLIFHSSRLDGTDDDPTSHGIIQFTFTRDSGFSPTEPIMRRTEVSLDNGGGGGSGVNFTFNPRNGPSGSELDLQFSNTSTAQQQAFCTFIIVGRPET